MNPKDQELNAELDHHLRALTADLEKKGHSPAEALRRARLAFGPLESIKDECRDERRGNWLFDLGRDMRHALRMLRRSPVLAAVAVLSLGLAIGANTAIFTLIDCLLLRSLPVEAPEQLQVVKWTSAKHPDDAVVKTMNGSVDDDHGYVGDPFSYPAYLALRAQMPLAGYLRADLCAVRAGGAAETAMVQPTSGNYYALLGVRPFRGRLLVGADDASNAPPVAVVSYRYWTRSLAADPAAIGRTLQINNRQFQIVGVTPAEFFGHEIGSYPDITIPLTQVTVLGGSVAEKNQPFTNRMFWWVKLITRAPVAEVGRLNATLVNSLAVPPGRPETTPSLRFEPAAESLSGVRREFSEPLRILMFMVALVLVIASANVANLLLARAVAREKEITTRLALGASTGRLMRQFLAEFLVLACLGSLLSLAIAYGLVQAILPLVPGRGEVAILESGPWNPRILAFTAGVSLLVTLLFGLWPARQAAFRRLSATTPKLRLTGALVVGQVALATVLILGAGLFVQTLRNLYNSQLGFAKDRLILFTVDVLQTGAATKAAYPFYREMQRTLAALPGVEAVSASQVRPLTNGGYWNRAHSAPGAGVEKRFGTAVHPSLPGYLETLGVAVTQGRTLTEGDGPLHRVVINDVFAEKMFATPNPIGQTFRLAGDPKAPLFEVVGLARNARYEKVRGELSPIVYRVLVPDSDFDYGEMTFAVRTYSNPASLLPAIRETVARLNPNLPLVEVRTLDQQIEDHLRQERLFALLCGGFAVLAVVLAALGLFGVLAYRVNRRQAELGIRLALGAPRLRLWWMVVGEGWRWLAIGLGIGAVGAKYSTSLVQKFLYGLQAEEYANWAAPIAVLVLVGTMAVAVPAWRACRVDPMVALRQD